MKPQRGRNSAYGIAYHMVWCVNYRKPLLTRRVAEHLKGLLYQVARDNGFTIETMEPLRPGSASSLCRTIRKRFFSNSLLAANAIEPLPVSMRHALHLYALPDFHRGPFDRLLIAQAQLENLPILTADLQIAGYPVEVIW
ncbi:transposase [Desulfovirgula thermocuniculi]|uniref:transposase n=1 Tax=Desulfovirgula thermocuniculi TaxID=348842 RepID=UPI001FE06DCC|nr:transposase [Desulfovirgula thermocuniculi]